MYVVLLGQWNQWTCDAGERQEIDTVTFWVIHTHTHTHTLGNSLQHGLSLLSLLCLHQSLPDNGFQRRIFPLPCIPELSPCLSYQRQRATAHNDWTTVFWLINSPMKSSLLYTALTHSNCPAYNISAWTAQKALFLCAVKLLLVKNLLPSIERCLQSHYIGTGIHTTYDSLFILERREY
jgi:hypothetical protein